MPSGSPTTTTRTSCSAPSTAPIPPTSMSRSQRRFAARSPTARRDLANASPRRRTSLLSRREHEHGAGALRILRDEGLLEVGRGRAITVAGTPERGVVVAKMKELIDFGRRNGFRRDELLAMMERARVMTLLRRSRWLMDVLLVVVGTFASAGVQRFVRHAFAPAPSRTWPFANSRARRCAVACFPSTSSLPVPRCGCRATDGAHRSDRRATRSVQQLSSTFLNRHRRHLHYPVMGVTASSSPIGGCIAPTSPPKAGHAIQPPRSP